MLNSSYLKELMMEHGMSLGQLSVRTGISKSQLSRILSGERGIGAKTIKGLKKAFPKADLNSSEEIPVDLMEGNI